MNAWTQLMIEPTHDQGCIKEAYAHRLLEKMPNEAEEIFTGLHKAYNEALVLSQKIGVRDRAPDLNPKPDLGEIKYVFNHDLPAGLQVGQEESYTMLMDTLREELFHEDVSSLLERLDTLTQADKTLDYYKGIRQLFMADIEEGYRLLAMSGQGPMSDDTQLMTYAYSALRQGDIQTSAMAFLMALARDKNKASAVKGMALCYFHLKRYRESLVVFEVLQSKQPYDFTCATYILKAYQGLKDTLEARSNLHKDEKTLLIKSLKAMGKYTEAFESMKAMEADLCGEELLALAMLASDVDGQAHLDNRRYLEKALLAYEKTGLNPALVVHKMGISFYDQHEETGDEDQRRRALDNFRKSQALDPSNPDNDYFIGLMLKETEDYDQALKHIEGALKVCLKIDYLVEKAVCLYNLDDYQACIDTIVYMDNFDYQNDYFAYSKYLQGYCHLQLDQFSQARACAERAQIDGYNPASVESLLESIGVYEKEAEKSKGFLGKLTRLFDH